MKLILTSLLLFIFLAAGARSPMRPEPVSAPSAPPMSFCDSLNAAVDEYYAIYPDGSAIWDFTSTLNSIMGGRHYDSASMLMVDNTDLYWFTKLQSCGISCPEIINCSNVSSLMASFEAQYPQYDSAAPSFLWANYLNDNGGGDIGDNAYKYTPEQWSALFICCGIVPPVSSALGTHCDTVNAVLADIPGVGTAYVQLYLIPDDLNITLGYNHYDSTSGLNIQNNFIYWYTQLKACGDSCRQITSCDDVNAAIRSINSNQIDTSVSYSYPLPVVEAYISLLFGYGGNLSYWEPILRCCAPASINFNDTLLGHCDSALLQQFIIRSTVKSDSCLPYWVYNYIINSNDRHVDTSIYQLCNDLTLCNLRCVPYCTTSITSICDSVNSANYVYSQLLASEQDGGLPTSDSSLLQTAFSILYGQFLSLPQILAKQHQCSPECDSFVAATSLSNAIVCSGSSTTITATTSGAAYLWSTSDTTRSLLVSAAGTYSVTITNASGCTASASDTVRAAVSPLPPAAPVFLSLCSDSLTYFLFDDVTAWGDQLEWSMHSDFSSSTIENPLPDSYVIEPFAVVAPGDSLVTVWMRTKDSLTGCVSASVSTVLLTNPLPLHRNIYAVDTIVPHDSTAVIVIPNSQNGILYTLEIDGYEVTYASGSGDTIYLYTPPVDTPTIVHVYGENIISGCPKHLYEARFSGPHVDSISSIYVTVYHSTPVQTCQPDTLFLTVKNNTASPVDTVILNLAISTPDFSLGSTAFNSHIGVNLHTPPVVTGGGSSVQVRLDTIPGDSTWSFSMILYTNCSAIPNSNPTSGGNIILKNDTTNRVNIWVSTPHDTVGVNDVANVTSTNPYHITLDSIEYPLFDVHLAATTHFDSIIYTPTSQQNAYSGCASLGDTFTRRSYFINKGSAAFSGGISIRDSMTCNGMTLLGAKLYFGSQSYVLSSPDSAKLLGQGLKYLLGPNGDTVGIGSDLILEETFVASSCLGLACQSIIIMTWGCDTTNLCKTKVPTPYTYVTRNCNQPAFRISRILPASNMPGTNPGKDTYWDNSCTNRLTKWEFEIQNADTTTSTLSNVHIILSKNDIGSYSMINMDSGFRMNIADPVYGGPLPSIDSFSYSLTVLTADTFDSIHRFVPACLSQMDTPILSLNMRISEMRRGDKFIFSFYTYQCCPSDTELFDQQFSMNHWTINAYGFYCGADGADSVAANAYSHPTFSPPYYNPYAGRNVPTAISPYVLDGGPDFGISQLFNRYVSSMSVPDTSIFCVENTFILSSAGLRDYQLLFQNGLNGDADSPSFRLIVDFDTDTGLFVSGPSNVSITGLGYTWYGTTLAHDSFHTEIAFDIHDLGVIDTAILGAHGASAFKAFFEGSEICFPISSYCPAVQPLVSLRVRTYLQPRWALHCDSCRIPLYQERQMVQVHCPGCKTPGIIVHGSSMKRVNYGLPDDLDIGLASSLSPITFPPSHPINDDAAIVGDTIRSYILADFVDGDPSTGVSYAGWQSYWNALGNTNDYFRYLFFEHDIPFSNTGSMNLNLVKDTLYFKPADSSMTYAVPLSISGTDVIHTGTQFIYRISIDEIRTILGNSSLSFKPGDVYQLYSYYAVCGNADLSSASYHSACVIQSYFTTPPDNALASHIALDPGAGDYFASHRDTTHVIPNDSILSPDMHLYYRCEGFTSDFNFYYVKYTVTDGSHDVNSSNNNTRCLKNITMGVMAEIIGPLSPLQHFYNNFPYEIKLIPGLTVGNSININDSTSPYAFLIKSIGQCYTVTPDFTQTAIYRHSGNTVITPASIQKITTGLHGTTTGPYLRFAFNPLYAVATASNYTSNANLLLGDEYFEQELDFQLTLPVCAGCPDTLKFNTDTTELTVIPSLSLCSGVTPDTIVLNNTQTFIRPHALDSPVIVSAPYVVDTSEFVITQVVNMTRDNPDNFYVYINSGSLPTGLVIDSIVSLNLTNPNHSVPLRGRGVTSVSIAPYLLFDLGFGPLQYGNSASYTRLDTLRFYFHWTTCPANLDTTPLYTTLPFLLNWQCGSFPTTLPDSSCHIPVSDPIPLVIEPAAFNKPVVVGQAGTFSSCDTLRFSLQVASYNYGQIHGLANVLIMPAGLTVVPGSITIGFHGTTVHTTMSHDSVIIPPYILNFGDTVNLSFKALAGCSYDGTPPFDMFYGISFCGNAVSPAGVTFNRLTSRGNLCGPFFTYDTISNVLCYGDSSGRISIGVDGSDSVYLFTCSPSIPDSIWGGSHFIATNVPAGIYTITVTDPRRGCSQTLKDTIRQPAFRLSDTITFVNAIPGNCSRNNATVTPSGGTPGYTYLWTGGVTTAMDTGLIGGSAYIVTITDSKGCVLKDTIVLPANPATVSRDSVVCSGNTVNLSVGTYSSYVWSTGATSQTIPRSVPGVYTVTVSMNGCFTTDTFVLITVPQPDPITTMAGYELCTFDSAVHIQFTHDYGIAIPTHVLDQNTCTQVCSGSPSRIAIRLSNPSDSFRVAIVGGTATFNSSLSSDTIKVYDIVWGATGQGNISVVELGAGICTSSKSFCIDILPAPTAKFGIIQIDSAGTYDLCTNKAVAFVDSSTIINAGANTHFANITGWIWDFGDGTGSNQQNPTHVYTAAGTYTVVLSVSSPCGCVSSDSMIVTVGLASGLDIQCPSIICQGGSATYTLSGCDTVTWRAAGGTITGSTATTVTITWDSVGASGFGYVTATPFDCGACLSPVTVKIPVITHSAPINGPTTICANNATYYTIPLWPGGRYTWSVVNGSPSPAVSFLSANNEYRLVLKDTSYGSFTLKVHYTDSIAGCIDSSFIVVTVAHKVTDSASPAIGCTGNAVIFTLSDSAVSKWVIVDPNGVADTLAGAMVNSITYTPTIAGDYVITVTNPNVCIDGPLHYHVDATPNVVDSLITGPDSVCRKTPYTYIARVPAPTGVQYVWSLPNPSDGSIVGSNIGNSVIVKWTNTTYAATCTLSISAQSTVNTSCVDTSSKDYIVHIIEPDPRFHRPLTVCANTLYTGVSAVSHAEDFYTWSFTPSNLASCVSGDEHSINPRIQFNNVTTPTTVTLTLTVTRCNQTVHTDSDVVILPLPTVSIASDSAICPLTAVTFTATTSVSWPNTTYVWTMSDGTVISSGTSNTLQYSFLSSGSYWIHVTARFADTCTGYVTSVNDSFTTYSGCAHGAGSGSGPGSSPGGGGGPPGPCAITFALTNPNVDCDDFVSLGVIYSGAGTFMSESWTVDSANYDVVPGTNISVSSPSTNSSSFSFQVYTAGYYDITYSVTLNIGGVPTTCSISTRVTVPLHMGYNSAFHCIGTNGGYVLNLTDNSNWVGTAPSSYTWSVTPRIGLPATYTGTNVTTAPLTLGMIYDISYGIVQNGVTCTRTFSDTAPRSVPNAAFYYDDAPLSAPTNRIKICEGFSITLQPGTVSGGILNPAPPNPNWIYHWHDNHDGADIIAYNPPKEYSFAYVNDPLLGQNPATIGLTVTDNFTYGCTASSSTSNYTVTKNLVVGDVSSTAPLVQPENAVYFCPGGGSIQFSYQVTSSPPGSPNQWNWYPPNSTVVSTMNYTTSGPDGRYLCIVKDADGCQQISIPAGVVQTLPMPPVTIDGRHSYCAGETVILTTTPRDSTTYSWSIDSLVSAGPVWSIPNLAAGNYTATLASTETFANTGVTPVTCTRNTTYSFTVYDMPTVVAAIDSINCDPYRITLIATDTSGLLSNYSWSNGATTQITHVTAGGDYRVWLTGPGNCVAYADVIVPDDPAWLIQYAPYGCYTYGCTALASPGVVLNGPPNTFFAAWTWLLNGSFVVSSGTNSPVSSYTAHYAGDYSLTLYDAIVGSDYCTSTSPIMHISASPMPCPMSCGLHPIVQDSCAWGDSVRITVTDSVYNGATYSLTSPSGTFVGLSPSTLSTGTNTIAATFVPNVGVVAPFELIITMIYPSGTCQDTVSFTIPHCTKMERMSHPDTAKYKMLLMPNPASDMVCVVYSTGPTNDLLAKGESLTLSLTDASGKGIEVQTLSKVSGSVTVDVSALRSGMYFVSLRKNHVPITTDKLMVTHY